MSLVEQVYRRVSVGRPVCNGPAFPFTSLKSQVKNRSRQLGQAEHREAVR